MLQYSTKKGPAGKPQSPHLVFVNPTVHGLWVQSATYLDAKVIRLFQSLPFEIDEKVLLFAGEARNVIDDSCMVQHLGTSGTRRT